MKSNTYNTLRSTLLSVILVFGLSSCKVFDDLVADLMDSGGLSSRNAYTVSCIDLMVNRNGLSSGDSDLGAKLKQAVTEGFDAARMTEKGKNLSVAHSLDKQQCESFYQHVLISNGVTTAMRRQYLSEVCDKTGANMLLWGVYSGDDTEIKVICFLYRLDLNDFTVSEPLSFSQRTPERQKQELVSKAVRDLFDKSMPDLGEPDTRKIPNLIKEASGAGKSLMPSIIGSLLNN